MSDLLIVIVISNRAGLICFTVVLTIGQLIFAIGGYKESFTIMMIGRFVFGLGGENMTVGQSAIISNWFKGNELNFAFGLNLSVARLGSTINGPVENWAAETHSVGFGLMIGLAICIFSLVVAFCLVAIDWWAEKKDNVQVDKDPNDAFSWREIGNFKLPFWLVTGSCVVIYMVIFIYIGNSEDMLVDKFGFTEAEASLWYTTPYIISAFASPVLGLLIDCVGKRALFICASSLMILVACAISMVIPDSVKAEDGGHMNKLIFIPLSMLGLGYSVYAAALWGSVPYVCEPKQIGTAYGLVTSVQNIGLTISPIIAGWMLSTKKDGGYFWYFIYFELLAIIGICFNLLLYVDDIKNRGGILNRVDKGEKLEDLMATPK